jgi:hypothetical protein
LGRHPAVSRKGSTHDRQVPTRDHATEDLGLFDELVENHSMVHIVMPVEMFLVLDREMFLELDRKSGGVRLDLLLKLVDEILPPQGDVGVVVEILNQSRGGSASWQVLEASAGRCG